MSILIDDRSAALVALPRPRVSLSLATWRPMAGSTKRGYETVAKPGTQDGRIAFAGAAYVTTNQHFSIRSGPPTERPPA